ncbi:MAG: heavy-metal-associated domain-containing protein [Spirosomataceae bacterium]
MKKQAFKTNINCGGCVAKVTNTLNTTVGENKWHIDISNPDKILTINDASISSDTIIEAIKKTGFKIENMN